MSMGFSRQEYWRGLPFPPPGDHPKPEMWVQFLDLEDPEKEMATCSGILAWEIPWTEEPGGL